MENESRRPHHVALAARWFVGSLVVVVLLAAFWVVRQAFWAGNVVASSARGVVTQTLAPANVIYNYDWFKQQYQDYLALKAKVVQSQQAVDALRATLPKDPSTWSYYQQSSFQQDEAVLQGQQYQLNDVVAAYNAHSQEVNRSIFKSGDLPAQLPYAN